MNPEIESVIVDSDLEGGREELVCVRGTTLGTRADADRDRRAFSRGTVERWKIESNRMDDVHIWRVECRAPIGTGEALRRLAVAQPIGGDPAVNTGGYLVPPDIAQVFKDFVKPAPSAPRCSGDCGGGAIVARWEKGTDRIDACALCDADYAKRPNGWTRYVIVPPREPYAPLHHADAKPKERTLPVRPFLLFTVDGKVKHLDPASAEAQRVADEAARKAAEDQQLAEAAAAEAAGDREAAEAIAAAPTFVPPVIVAPAIPKVAGIARRETWSAKVTDLAALVRAVANGQAPLTALTPNMTVLNGLARSMQAQMRIPGVQAFPTSGIGAGAR